MTLFSDLFVLVGSNYILKENIFCIVSLFTLTCLDLCTDIDFKHFIELLTCNCCYGGHSRVGGLGSELLLGTANLTRTSRVWSRAKTYIGIRSCVVEQILQLL